MLFVIVTLPTRISRPATRTEHKSGGDTPQALHHPSREREAQAAEKAKFPNMMEARTHCVEHDREVKEGFFRRRIARPIVELLREGVTPEKMALSLALGAALGVFPMLGTTTALCALVAFIWRLNLPAMQIVNYFVYPLQIALLIPFFRAGEKLFGAPRLPLSVAQILAMAHASFWGATRFLWTTIWHAALAWCLIAPALVAMLYVILAPLFRRLTSQER
jgi:uncharacterized protein (DUF2062 family)